MELPYHLKTLEPLPSALDILRFLGERGTPADVDEICDGLDITERRFSKAIRRLVTKGYVQMDGDMIYRLSPQGREAVTELAEFDAANPGHGLHDSDSGGETVVRQLVVALPRVVMPGYSIPVVVGMNGADNGQPLSTPADMVLRLSVINGEPGKPQEKTFQVGNEPASQVFSIVPGAFDRIRVRVQVFQLGPNPDDINVAGGMYVDVDVAQHGSSDLVAYGTELNIQVLE